MTHNHEQRADTYERFGYLPHETDVPLTVRASVLDPEFTSHKPNLTPITPDLVDTIAEIARKIAQETGPVPPLKEDSPEQPF